MDKQNLSAVMDKQNLDIIEQCFGTMEHIVKKLEHYAHADSDTINRDESDKFIIDLMESPLINDNLICTVNIYVGKYIIYDDDSINWDLLHSFIKCVKKQKYSNHDFHVTLLNICIALCRHIFHHYVWGRHLCIDTYRLLLLSYNKKYKSVCKDVIGYVLFLYSKLPRRVRIHAKKMLQIYLEQGIMDKYIDSNNVWYQDFCIMFPDKVNEVKSKMLLNKLI